ncbi:DmsC/YnfH family molybdoenzyme membrane anchor subunit [Planctomyces sp. SH-PL62]|uniref:DmsC/YnfH family molybdoenzyme membrane anchor subunit n=1 Tax=Planctomyces sp. SH-PL62 TaxID=1636152 RepID=UPI00078C8B6F|nr:DmsC/YnfH family molybdoenzyme membrane anchor subunit [Planctomyces sp. SH-PL62]AMV38403.1 Anaerobic dimethyl sulfoxide reductase chain B [Planctomyces sp. SH-PL62]
MRFVDEGTSLKLAERVDRSEAGVGGRRDDRLVDSLLAEQGDLSAVERFARLHRGPDEPVGERFYSALLPAGPPGPGQQLAFEVDLDRCSGCKACVSACHALNGLDEGETWRDVGLLVGGTAALPVIQHVTTACHHCLEPACLAACPVEAYEKEPITGIVRHLDDQCIGCQYCTLACPYDVPKYHADKGIVRKCDMCADRLKEGEAPACVQACPHEAIRIRVVDVADVRADSEAGAFLPGAFDPSYTRPTTRFTSLRPGLPGPAGGDPTAPEHGHSPLAVMLVLTQLAAGGFLVELAARLADPKDGLSGPALARLSLALGLVGLVASVLHLGRPLYAYRAVLGLRHSWLSREVATLGLFAKLATAYVAADWLAGDWMAARPEARLGLLAAVAAAGAAGVACSVMVYHAVRRPFWRASVSGWKFAGTAAVLGLASALACLGAGRAGWLPAPASGRDAAPFAALAVALGLVTAAKLRFEARDCDEAGEDGPLGRTARLLRGPMRRIVTLRRLLGIAGGVVLPAVAAAVVGREPHLAAQATTLAFATCLAGEILERHLFFTAVSRPTMPGGLPS